MTIFDFLITLTIVLMQTFIGDFIAAKLEGRTNKIVAQLLGLVLAFFIFIAAILGYYYVRY